MDQEHGAREQTQPHQVVGRQLHPNTRELHHIRHAGAARKRRRGTRPDPRADSTAADVPTTGSRLHQAGRQHD